MFCSNNQPSLTPNQSFSIHIITALIYIWKMPCPWGSYLDSLLYSVVVSFCIINLTIWPALREHDARWVLSGLNAKTHVTVSASQILAPLPGTKRLNSSNFLAKLLAWILLYSVQDTVSKSGRLRKPEQEFQLYCCQRSWRRRSKRSVPGSDKPPVNLPALLLFILFNLL